MRKFFYILILSTALVTVGLQYAYISKLEGEIAHLQVLYDDIEKIVAEMKFAEFDI